MGANVANHLYDLTTTIQPKNGAIEVDFMALAKDAAIHYTLDGSEPTQKSNLFKTPIKMEASSTIKAQAFSGTKKVGRAWSQAINLHPLTGKNIELKTQPSDKYSGGGNGSIINGVLGSNERYGDAEWLGFDGDNLEAIIDLQKETVLKKLNFRFFNGEGQWIYLPKAIQIAASNDGNFFENIALQKNITGDKKVVEVIVPVEKFKHQYLKILVENFGTIPDGAQGGGNKSWLFVDEITAE